MPGRNLARLEKAVYNRRAESIYNGGGWAIYGSLWRRSPNYTIRPGEDDFVPPACPEE
jgi:hypothetical protein